MTFAFTQSQMTKFSLISSLFSLSSTNSGSRYTTRIRNSSQTKYSSAAAWSPSKAYSSTLCTSTLKPQWSLRSGISLSSTFYYSAFLEGIKTAAGEVGLDPGLFFHHSCRNGAALWLFLAAFLLKTSHKEATLIRYLEIALNRLLFISFRKSAKKTLLAT